MDRLLDEKERLIENYLDGMSIDAIAAQERVSCTPVRRLLLNAGITLRPPVRHALAGRRGERAIKLYRNGASTREVAKLLGVKRDTVSEHLARAGLRRTAPLAKQTFRVPTGADLGILAGLLLGEGSIIVRPSDDAVISIVNTDPAIIGWLEQWGGRTYWHPPRPRGKLRCATWRIGAAVDVFHCLTALRPLLVGKKKLRANHALAHLRSRYGLEIAVSEDRLATP